MFLFSGEELEYWLLKTAIGFYCSGNVSKDNIRLRDTQSLNELCSQILYNRTLHRPCGIYVRPIDIPDQINQSQLQPLSDDNNKRMVGFRISYLSFAFFLLFDPDVKDCRGATESQTYRPDYLMIRNAKRTHTIMLTWPSKDSTTRQVVLAGF